MEASSQSSSQQILWKDVSPILLFLFFNCFIYIIILKNYLHLLSSGGGDFRSLQCQENGNTLKLLQLNKLSTGGSSGGLRGETEVL